MHRPAASLWRADGASALGCRTSAPRWPWLRDHLCSPALPASCLLPWLTQLPSSELASPELARLCRAHTAGTRPLHNGVPVPPDTKHTDRTLVWKNALCYPPDRGTRRGVPHLLVTKLGRRVCVRVAGLPVCAGRAETGRALPALISLGSFKEERVAQAHDQGCAEHHRHLSTVVQAEEGRQPNRRPACWVVAVVACVGTRERTRMSGAGGWKVTGLEAPSARSRPPPTHTHPRGCSAAGAMR